MHDRRTFLGLAAAAAAVLSVDIDAQAPAGQTPRELARHPLSGPLSGFDVVVFELNPGSGTGRDHRHTGPVLGYVLDGSVRFGVDHGPAQIVSAGSTFFEPTGALHSTFGSANADARAKVLAFMVVPTGSTGTVPA
jgi:quercetin dioxygenase-like cupin family protein